ncbi:hypothetical protein [Candidatus Avelusimicrobium faecicola]|uniref:hypothetical protein n=1 Tax=Candidatus Avelusimicrobium faecicola TaxID=3416205 RepID=UPI003D0F723E
MPKIKCTIYTRKPTELGLEIELNLLQNQENKERRPACPPLCKSIILGKTSVREVKKHQQKRRPLRSALKNGGAENFDGVVSLRLGSRFPCLSGK